MLDLLIIAAYIYFALKYLFLAFGWFEKKFNIYGKQETLPPQQITTQKKEAVSSKNIPANEKSFEQLKPSTITKPVQRKEAAEAKLSQNIIRQNKTEENSKETIQNSTKKVTNKEQIKQLIEEKITSKTQPILQKIQGQRPVVVNIQTNQPQTLEQPQNKSQQSSAAQKLQAQMAKEAYEQLKRQNQELRNQRKSLTEKLQTALEQAQNQKQAAWKLSEQVIKIKNDYQKLISQMQEKELKREDEFARSIQTRDDLLKLQEQEAHLNNNKLSGGIVNETIDSMINKDSQKTSEQLKNLQVMNEQLKSQLQFCQSQLQQSYESQNKLKKELEELNQTIQSQNEGSRVKTRNSVSITDVIHHPEYIRIKEKLQRYESGVLGSSRPRSRLREQMTPQGDRLNKEGGESRLSQRLSFISSHQYKSEIIDRPLQTQGIFVECNFLNEQSKTFILDEIKKIKKIPIKKSKILFKLDKLATQNPHENIDNIPNLVILIELTNGKVLGGFTQIAFSKDETMGTRSRYGSNKALLMDVTNKLAFINNTPNDTIIYDENAIVWGRDQMVIKNDQPTLLYSSFGHENGVYWDGKHTLEDFLGGQQNFERINQYEIYRIYIN